MGTLQSSGASAFTVDDADTLRRDIPTLAAVAPMASRSMTTVYGNANWSTQVTGSINVFFTARNSKALASSVLLASLLKLRFIFNAPIVAIAFAFSAAIGVIFGYFPARKAAQLDPNGLKKKHHGRIVISFISLFIFIGLHSDYDDLLHINVPDAIRSPCW